MISSNSNITQTDTNNNEAELEYYETTSKILSEYYALNNEPQNVKQNNNSSNNESRNIKQQNNSPSNEPLNVKHNNNYLINSLNEPINTQHNNHLSKCLDELIRKEHMLTDPKIKPYIDKWNETHKKPSYPNEVHINNASEFDTIKHKDVLIIFPAGGKVGDAEWKLQYYHNSTILHKYYVQLKQPTIAPTTFIYLKNHVQNLYQKFTIEIMCDNMLVSKYESEWINIIIETGYDIIPPIQSCYDKKYIMFIPEIINPNYKVFLCIDNKRIPIETQKCEY